MWKGSSNQRVIDVQKTLLKEDKTIPVLHCGDYYSNPITPDFVQEENISGCGCGCGGKEITP
ncbi:MAG: hypothetical protein IK121_01385, partial [Lachnospiraceae bacterium]|nr:hypothetical protein [Lachnospiraceae bacterium]